MSKRRGYVVSEGGRKTVIYPSRCYSCGSRFESELIYARCPDCRRKDQRGEKDEATAKI